MNETREIAYLDFALKKVQKEHWRFRTQTIGYFSFNPNGIEFNAYKKETNGLTRLDNCGPKILGPLKRTCENKTKPMVFLFSIHGMF